MTAYVKENGIWKKSNISSVKVDGEWKKTKKGFVKVDGVWKRFFSAGNEITSDIGEQTDYVKIVDGEEQTWRLWTWDGAGADGEATASFEVVTSIADFEILLLGMGGCAPGDTGMGGGGGGWVKATVSKDEMPEGTYNFTLGQYYRDSQGSAVFSLNVTSQLQILDTTLTATRGGNGGVRNGGSSGSGGGGGTGAVSGTITSFSTGSGGAGGYNYGSGGSAGVYSSISGEELDYCGGGGSGAFKTTVTTYGGPGWDSNLNGRANASGGGGANMGANRPVGEIGGGGKRGGGAGGSSYHQYKYQPGSNGVLMISYRID